MTDFMVLTIDAAQAAIGEKDCSRSPLAYQTGFFPLVQGNKGNTHLIPRTAKARPPGTVNTTAARAEITIRNIKHRLRYLPFCLNGLFLTFLHKILKAVPYNFDENIPAISGIIIGTDFIP